MKPRSGVIPRCFLALATASLAAFSPDREPIARRLSISRMEGHCSPHGQQCNESESL